jgi:membrane-associated phospholipid phosphatase
MRKLIEKEIRELNTLPKSLPLFAAGAASLLLFLLVMFLETQRLLGNFDLMATFSLQRITPRFLDVPLSFFSLLGSFEVITVFLVILGIWIFRRGKRIFYPLGLFGAILAFEFIGKLLLFHPGPPRMFFRYDLPFIFPSSFVETTGSFPSGHVSRTIFLLIVSAFVSSRLLGNKNLAKALLVVYFFLGAVMVFSRIYLGEHWASDTIGGFLLGAATGLLAVSYF